MDIPQVFIVLTNEEENTDESDLRCYILHRPAKFIAQLVAPPTRWDNKIFATVGNVDEHNSTIMHFPNQPFDQMNQVQVPSIDWIDETFTMQPQFPLVGPFNGDEENPLTMVI